MSSSSVSGEVTSFRDLLESAQSGDSESVERIIAAFSPIIERECSRYGLWQHPDWSHSDLIQEVVLRVWTKLGKFRGVNTSEPKIVFEHWVRVTAQSVLKNLHRKRKAKKRNPDSSVKVFDEAANEYSNHRNSERTPSSIFAGKDEIEKLKAVMEEFLDEDANEILELRIVEGLSLKDISERLPLTYDQVRYKYQTSLELLEQKMKSD